MVPTVPVCQSLLLGLGLESQNISTGLLFPLTVLVHNVSYVGYKLLSTFLLLHAEWTPVFWSLNNIVKNKDCFIPY